MLMFRLPAVSDWIDLMSGPVTNQLNLDQPLN